jgi:hypothetical protein
MREVGGRFRSTGIAALLIVLTMGCAAPNKLLHRVDEQRLTIGRGFTDVIDAADRAFGEPRVEDAERIVRVSIGPDLTIRENEGTGVRFPIRLRAPFPALERWANIFLQIDTLTDTFNSLGDFGGSVDRNKAIDLTWLSQIGNHTHIGVKERIYWSDGPQSESRVFARLEYRPDPYHVTFEQSAYYRTDDHGGGRTVLLADRKLGGTSFVRLALRAEYNEELPGTDLAGSVIYRRPFLPNSFLSGEVGVIFNPRSGPSGAGVTPDPLLSLDEQDDDEAFLAIAVIGKLWRPWIEYEVRPAVSFPWHHQDVTEFWIRLGFRIVYETYLSGK